MRFLDQLKTLTVLCQFPKILHIITPLGKILYVIIQNYDANFFFFLIFEEENQINKNECATLTVTTHFYFKIFLIMGELK